MRLPVGYSDIDHMATDRSFRNELIGPFVDFALKQGSLAVSGESSGMGLEGRENLRLEVPIMVPVTPESSIRIRQVVRHGTTVVLEAAGSLDTARCPLCDTPTRQIHDRYVRRR